jgi:thiol-disulfide isomerase/thioredoxin
MKKYFILVFIISIFYSYSYSQESKPIEIVNFHDLETRLKMKRDTVLVVNFWATWCVPCRKELPDFEKINRDFAGKPVKILLVSLDFVSELDHLKWFIDKNQISSEVIVLNAPDANNWINKIDDSWSGSLPATVFLKNEKKKFYEGALDYNTIQTEINTMLKL